MREKLLFRLVHAEARQRAAEAVRQAPDGWIVEVAEPTRTTAQNALMWVLLTKFSKQLLWPVNGERVKLQPEEWKDLLTAAFSEETQRIAMGLNGGMVLLGQRTSKFGKARFIELIEFILATAAERGVLIAERDQQWARHRAANMDDFEQREAVPAPQRRDALRH